MAPQNIFKFAVVDLGQVLFVFFILVPWISQIATGRDVDARHADSASPGRP